MMPKVANGFHLDADLARARAENLRSWSARGTFVAHRDGRVRLLGFVNHADMGNYREAINDFLAGQGPRPDIIATRQQGRVKYGFGLNFEQDLTKEFGLFSGGLVGATDETSRSLIRKWTALLKSAVIVTGKAGTGRTIALASFLRMNGIVADHAAIPGAWRTWVSAGRRRADLWARENL